MTVSVAGKQGADSSLPFGIRNPTPASPSPTVPVWVLAQTYPRLAGSSEPGGATTSNRKTFDFGPLEPGKTTEAVWKLSAGRGRPLHPSLRRRCGAQRDGQGETAAGVKPGGSFVVRISETPPNTTVTDYGQIVEIGKSGKGSKCGPAMRRRLRAGSSSLSLALVAPSACGGLGGVERLLRPRDGHRRPPRAPASG